MERKDDLYYLSVSKNLKRLRKDQGLSQQGLANRCNVDRSKIGKIENCRLDFRYSTIVQLAIALGGDVEELVSIKNSEKK